MSGLPEEITPEQAAGSNGAVWLDVREPWETDICAIEGSVHIPLGQLANRYQELDPEKHLIVLCHHGVRSLHAVRFLRHQGLSKSQSLAGGIDRWALDLDPAMERY